MKKIGRNNYCPCGSGRKYKNCCGAKQPQHTLPDLTAGLRMKGGICYDPTAKGYFVIVHVLDNTECRGEPQEWRYPEVFQTEDEAMRYYKTVIGPSLKQMMEKSAEDDETATFIHRKLE